MEHSAENFELLAKTVEENAALKGIFDEIINYQFDGAFFGDTSNYNTLGWGGNKSLKDVAKQDSIPEYRCAIERLFSGGLDTLDDYTSDSALSHTIIHYYLCIALDMLARKFTSQFIQKEYHIHDLEYISELDVSDSDTNYLKADMSPYFTLQLGLTSGKRIGVHIEFEFRTLEEYDPTHLEELFNHKLLLRLYSIKNNDTHFEIRQEVSLNNLTYTYFKTWIQNYLIH